MEGNLRNTEGRIPSLDGIGDYLVKGSAGVGVFRLVNTVLMLVTSIMIARWLGANGFGIYTYIFSLMMLISTPVQNGIVQLVSREIAVFVIRSEWELFKGIVLYFLRTLILFSMVLIPLAIILAGIIRPGLSTDMRVGFYLALLSIPAVFVGSVMEGCLRGLKHPAAGRFPDSIFRPLSLLVIISFLFLLNKELLTVTGLVISRVTAQVLTMIVATALFFLYSPSSVKNSIPRYEKQLWIRQALPFLLLGSIYIINNRMDVLMIGIFLNASDVGVYHISFQLAGFISFFLVATNPSLQPVLAQLYISGEMAAIQQMVFKVARNLLMISLVVSVVLLVFGKHILNIGFGPEFTAGYPPMAILAIGHLFSVGSGSVAQILNMTGHEKESLRAMIAGVLTNFILNLILIPTMGINGAAVATSISLVIWNSIMAVYVLRKLNIDSTALGILSSFKKVTN